MMKKDESDDKGGSHKGNNGDDEGDNTDSWDDMYQAARSVGIDEDNNDEDGGEDGGENKSEKAADNEDRDWGENRDGNNVMESNGRRGVSGRKDDEGGNGMKRKNQDDEPATGAKRSKGDVSRDHQAAAKPMKKGQLKKKSGGKKN